MLKPLFDNIPQAMQDSQQWVNWKTIEQDGESATLPYQSNGQLAKTDDPWTWNTFETTKAAADQFDGVGIVLTQEMGIVSLGFNKCRCPGFDGVAPWAYSLDTVLPAVADCIRRLNTYTEVSPLRKGIMAIVKGKLPDDLKKKGDMEVYQAGQYLAVTGHALDGFPRTIEHRQKELDAFMQTTLETHVKPPDEEAKPHRHTLDGDWRERLEKAKKSKNWSEINDIYYCNKPSDPSHEDNLALCSFLACWFDGDAAAIDAAFRESWIPQDKWDQKRGDGRTYGEATIAEALKGCQFFYKDQPQEDAQPVEVSHINPEPIPFGNSDDLPEFPVEAILDDVCREMVIETSQVMQIDPGFTATALIGTLSATAMGKYKIDLITHSEHSNLYLVGVLDSGERKSPTANIMFRPLYDYEISIQVDVEETTRNQKNDRTIRENRLKKLQQTAATGRDREKAQAAMREAAALVEELTINPAPTLPLYTCNDVTTEKLAVLMAENNEQMSVLSAEGGIFDILAGRYSEGQGNIDLYLQAYSHDPVSIHRIQRESITLRNPSLTICLGVQPAVIEEIGRHKRFRGRGLLARFLYAKCKPQAGNRPRREQRADEGIISRYNAHITNLMGIRFTETVIVRLSPEAQTLWNDFYNDIDKEMAPDGKLYHLKDWGNKLPGTVARIAGLFHYSKYGLEIGNHPISVSIVSASCAIGIYFMEHARAIFRVMNEPENIKIAKAILHYINHVKPESFKGRDVMRHTNLQTMEEVGKGLEVLCQRSFIKPDESGKSKGMGRPESTVYRVNPRLLNL